MTSRSTFSLALLLALAPGLAAGQDYVPLVPNPDRVVEGVRFDDIFQVVRPDGTIQEFGRCGAPRPEPGIEVLGPLSPTGGSTADCDGSSDATAIGGAPPTIYDPEHPDAQNYLIDVWVHVLRNTPGTEGDIPVAELYEQVAILNEDLRAIPGSYGDAGADGRLFFRLKGFDFSNNTLWFNDLGSYYNSLIQTNDPDHNPLYVVNVYTNTASGNLGYVPFLPHESPGSIGDKSDRIVIEWQSFGRQWNSFWQDQYDLGRTLTHELGHYLGLPHTFEGGCASGASPACFSNGDLICDTPPEQTSTSGCPAGKDTCGGIGPDPIHNYLDYSFDLCMDQFTLQQMRRIRCTIEHYRSGLFQPVLFYEDFETGNTDAWDTVVAP